MWSDITRVAPRLVTFSSNLVSTNQVSVGNDEEVLCSAEDEWVDEATPLNPETDGGQIEIMETQVNGLTRSKEPRRIQRRKMAIVSALSSLCCAKTSQSNLFQFGYYLYASRTPKRVIEVLSQLGLSVSYASITIGVRAVTKEAQVSLAELLRTLQVFTLCLDNVNLRASVQNRSQQLAWTIGYVAANPKTDAKEMFTSDDVDYSKAFDLEIEDLILSQHDYERNTSLFSAAIYDVLHEYCEEHMAKYRMIRMMHWIGTIFDCVSTIT